MTELEEAPALVPPKSGNGAGTSFRGEGSGAALVITYAAAGVGLGKRMDVRSDGIAVGHGNVELEVPGAAESGSQLRIERDVFDAECRNWFALGVGAVRLNGHGLSRAALKSGDGLRVVDTFFRFLCGEDLDHQYHETIYHLTILDTPTGLHNARYFREALERDLARARNEGTRLSVATIQFEVGSDRRCIASHDVLGEAAVLLRGHVHRDEVVARSEDLELAAIFPNVDPEEVRERLSALFRPLGEGLAMRLGVAASDAELDAEAMIKNSRAEARLLSG